MASTASVNKGAPVPPPNPLHITVRFTTSIPDILIDIPEPNRTSVVALKQLLRTKVDIQTSLRRFRLIYSGKLLRDDNVLSSVLKIPSAPPRPLQPSGKGKEKEIDIPPPRVYINCSIGDVLTPSELADEGVAAIESSKTLRDDSTVRTVPNNGIAPLSTTATPRGFDRLLSAGFTAAEVNQLRLQFLSIQANINTPDTMPSPTTLRMMEDAWIDNNVDNTGAGEAFDFGDNATGGGALDDLVWGNIMGFLWPLGCIGWVIREEGVWSTRRQMAVFTGFMLCIAMGMLRVMS